MRIRGIVGRLTSLISFLAALLVLGSCDTNAHDTKSKSADIFRVGLKSIALSAPSNELVETGSDYRVMIDAFTPAANRLVAAFLRPEDLKAIQNGPTSLSRYALVEVPRGAEFSTITPEIFKQIAANVGQEFGASLDTTLKDQQDEINRRLKGLGASSTTLTFDKPMMLGSFFSKPDALGFGGIIPVELNGKKNKMVMVVSVVRTQDRVLYLYLYNSYVDQESINWARTVSDRWADTILSANK